MDVINNDVPLLFLWLFLYCTGAGSLDQILVAQVGSGAGRGARVMTKTRNTRAPPGVAM